MAQRCSSTPLCNHKTSNAHTTPAARPTRHYIARPQNTPHHNIAIHTIHYTLRNTTNHYTPCYTPHYTPRHTPHPSKLFALLVSRKPILSEKQTLSQDYCVPMKQLAVLLLVPLATCTPVSSSCKRTINFARSVAKLVLVCTPRFCFPPLKFCFNSYVFHRSSPT